MTWINHLIAPNGPNWPNSRRLGQVTAIRRESEKETDLPYGL